MHTNRLWCLAAALPLLAGCASSGATPKYVTNFSQVRTGMNKSQVSKILGWPSIIATAPDGQVHVVMPDANDPWSALRQDIDMVFSDGELWQYGQYNLSDLEEPPELMAGSLKSFLVYFDNHGHVTRMRPPIQGPYAQPPVYGVRSAASPTPSELWGGDPFGRDKANVGPTTTQP